MSEGKLKKKYKILIQFDTWGFMMSLYPNLPKNFRNSRWRIKYGRRNVEKNPIRMQIGIFCFLELLITKK